ncbi:21741_t:CDS:1, partial [Racocetra persica]
NPTLNGASSICSGSGCPTKVYNIGSFGILIENRTLPFTFGIKFEITSDTTIKAC